MDISSNKNRALTSFDLPSPGRPPVEGEAEEEDNAASAARRDLYDNASKFICILPMVESGSTCHCHHHQGG